MQQTKLLYLLLLSGILLFAACSDLAGPESENEGENGDPVEPTATINDPGDGSTLKGEVTVSIQGEAENGFDEARIYLGNEMIQTISDPTLPYEGTLETQNYENGTYDLSAELDVAGQDTSLSLSVSVTLENYLVELETDGYIASLNQQENLVAQYMFVADYEGNVLRAIELTSRSDGTIQLLPPEAIEGEAPSEYSITIADLQNFETQNGSFEVFQLGTTVGLEAWSKIYKYGNTSTGEEPDEPVTTDVTITLRNHPNVPLFSVAIDPLFRDYGLPFDGSVSQTTASLREDAEELLLLSFPEDPALPPQYHWEQSVQDSLDNSGQLRYDVAGNENFEGFQDWDVVDVAIPSNVEITNYNSIMSAEPDTWEEGQFALFPNTGGLRDGNDSNTQLGMYVLNMADHLYETEIRGTDDAGASYRQKTFGDLPGEFTALDANLQLTNRSLDDLQMDISGSFDYMNLEARAYSETSHDHFWVVYMPDTMETFVYPKIADSLGQEVQHYNRSEFELWRFEMSEIEAVEGFAQFLNDQIGPESERSGNLRSKTLRKRKNLTTEQQKIPAVLRNKEAGPYSDNSKANIPDFYGNK